jgi:predicted transcriptional regulator
MDRPTANTDALRCLLKKQKIATLDELKQAIGTTCTMTVFRRLKELGYRTSYSHRGKFYTLADTPQFDNDGLWSHQSVGFSRFGNLLHTTQEFVEQAAAGFTAAELRSLLHVEVKQSLLQLVRQKQLRRERMGRHFVYWARAKERRTRQKQQRQAYEAAWEIGVSPLREELSQELNAAIVLFSSLLDEKQRRLYAGLESFKLGHGGDRKIAEFLGLDVHTVARGRRELFRGDVEQEGVRKKGAGRKAVEKKRRK